MTTRTTVLSIVLVAALALLTATLVWQPAEELFAARRGPWKDLSPRRSEPMSKVRCRPVALRPGREFLLTLSDVT